LVCPKETGIVISWMNRPSRIVFTAKCLERCFMMIVGFSD
jgi:hypothetical protein